MKAADIAAGAATVAVGCAVLWATATGHHREAAAPAWVDTSSLAQPAAGSYRLERIALSPDGTVLDSDGSAHRLRAFTTGKVTVFSFIYTTCSDQRGCPLAMATLHAVRDAIAADPALRNQVRFVSMSFNPAYDTPPMMRSYGGGDALARDAPQWRFLTTASTVELAPLLAGFGQDVAVVQPDTDGGKPLSMRHMLKVWLIDPAGMVREIYSPAYLQRRVLYNDIVTVAMERPDRTARRD